MSRMTGTPRSVPSCAADPERMFPVAESRNAGHVTEGECRALQLCQACPLLAECRIVALGMELPYGVAGGLTAADRRAARAEGRRADAAVGAA